MTPKLFNHILATCLLFGSLYLPAYAVTTNNNAAAKTDSPSKTSPETSFLEGHTCLKQGNIPCARLALAGIPSNSAYAKLLQGNIAFSTNQTDKALLLLLPLQTETELIPEAKTALHLNLAAAFETLEDTSQAMLHLIQAETVITASNLEAGMTDVNDVHEKIWALLGKLEQTDLVELRGNNTDSIFQGWVDLLIASRNQHANNSITQWRRLYPDHPAQAFAKNLTVTNTDRPAMQALSSTGSIALIMPLSVEAYSAKASAFQQGLQTALAEHTLNNQIKTYPSTENPLEIDAAQTLAQNEGNTYFIIPDFNADRIADIRLEKAGAQRILHIGHSLDEEAQHIVRYALDRGMQKITIITATDTASQSMTTRFEAAWDKLTNHEGSEQAIARITLTDTSAPDRLADLSRVLSEKIHDMVLLAIQPTDARLVRPQIPISTPVMAFSIAHELMEDNATNEPLNTVRLFEMPYLLDENHISYHHDETIRDDLNSNELSRWFALGMDSLQLLIAGEHLSGHEISINGLSGTLTLSPSGLIKRQLSPAILTHDGIAPAQ